MLFCEPEARLLLFELEARQSFKTWVPYKSMVIEALGKAGWGARRFALNFMEESLSSLQSSPLAHAVSASSFSASSPASSRQQLRPWCFCEVNRERALLRSQEARLYLPALSANFRQAVAAGRLMWVVCDESQAPQLTQTLLESGLCQGVLLHGLEHFPKSQPAGIWGRRWQLAAQKGDTHLLWVHEKAHAVIGFDVRIEWTAKESYEIKRGHGYFHEQRLKKTFFTQRPAA